MKKYIILIFLFLSLSAFAQNKTDIDKNWKSLKKSFILKTEIVLKLTNKLRTAKVIEKTELDKTVFNAKKLKVTCENEVLNRESVDKVKQGNDELNTHLVRILVTLESDFKMKTSNEVLSINDQLSTTEEQIFTRTKKYNDSCLSLNETSLIFKTTSNTQSPEVKF
ncbi:LemA family protein [Flavobacterium sp.]|uniref:LemA family protein n=1 Tax=Flavobacterium sp. TaxID=239 RepID=UPI0031D99B61